MLRARDVLSDTVLPDFEVEATYEQCPWEPERVFALYRNLSGSATVDGRWRRLPSDMRVSLYRVSGSYFQAIFARRPGLVTQLLKMMDPPPSLDDAGWSIGTLSSGGYGVGSCFAITPGMFDHQEALNDWLAGYGILLAGEGSGVTGVAALDQIDTASMRDAMRRLNWLENALDEVNQELDRAGRNAWEAIRAKCKGALDVDSESVHGAAHLPLPEEYFGTSGKRREPVDL